MAVKDILAKYDSDNTWDASTEPADIVAESSTPKSGVHSVLSKYGAKIETAVPEKPVESTLSQIGTQLAAGATTELPKMAGQALEYFAPEGSAVEQYGKEVAQSAEERAKLNQPDIRGKNAFQEALITGARSAVPSVAAGAGYAINPVAGTLGTIGLFGGSQAQETKEKLISQGVPESEAKKAAIAAGLVQGGGEAIANRLTAGIFGAGKKAAVEGVKGLIGRETDKAVLKPYLKSVGEAAIGEPLTEVAQDIGTQAIERAYGAKPEQSYAETARGSALGALGMTALLAPFGLGGHYAKSKSGQYVSEQLANGESDEAKRQKVVKR